MERISGYNSGKRTAGGQFRRLPISSARFPAAYFNRAKADAF
jgi:hypothetical protein